jgi:hypothetical protein
LGSVSALESAQASASGLGWALESASVSALESAQALA